MFDDLAENIIKSLTLHNKMVHRIDVIFDLYDLG